jgi:hypothetical protein
MHPTPGPASDAGIGKAVPRIDSSTAVALYDPALKQARLAELARHDRFRFP